MLDYIPIYYQLFIQVVFVNMYPPLIYLEKETSVGEIICSPKLISKKIKSTQGLLPQENYVINSHQNVESEEIIFPFLSNTAMFAS